MIYEMTRNKRNENRKTRHVLDLREREKPEQGRLA